MPSIWPLAGHKKLFECKSHTPHRPSGACMLSVENKAVCVCDNHPVCYLSPEASSWDVGWVGSTWWERSARYQGGWVTKTRSEGFVGPSYAVSLPASGSVVGKVSAQFDPHSDGHHRQEVVVNRVCAHASRRWQKSRHWRIEVIFWK